MKIKVFHSAKAVIEYLECLGIDPTDLFVLSYTLLKDNMDNCTTYVDSYKNDKGDNVRIWYKRPEESKYILCYDIE